MYEEKDWDKKKICTEKKLIKKKWNKKKWK
jgi:hypothetical protein